jgi:hypothetical protein
MDVTRRIDRMHVRGYLSISDQPRMHFALFGIVVAQKYLQHIYNCQNLVKRSVAPCMQTAVGSLRKLDSRYRVPCQFPALTSRNDANTPMTHWASWLRLLDDNQELTRLQSRSYRHSAFLYTPHPLLFPLLHHAALLSWQTISSCPLWAASRLQSRCY